jgi:inhibitor of cysteine peptidase
MAEVEIRESGVRAVVAADDRVIIRLPENATTGYQWTIDDMPNSLEVERNDLIPPGSDAPGAAGERRIVLRARRPGAARVGLSLRRPWESTTARETFEAMLDVT